ncbi:50S ribosomal protein L6 [Companilactobacillus crustorum]|uniref:Large ribosomal subunit protein uL6 n=3 Tax=Companilactobacillus TaxID=2767879 RepID=A0A837RJC3_9LACO|nr:50S ribosomal protein L6 [Companilactobacillus crustorum]APU70773.1 50S ribosomal protein L6 [Companilactobacillus crustorum]KRK44125.1 50S ribosomal protein L6 [Companilactobacillus crustorum JCM 15951]KRO21500.1 50S ribosomal protein L6 [Companilactobacillus crustorum]WDT65017.1 50S ribosomal protein L6 [Companilactobacillus crustorum]GEO75743.1 50S ribosomal protein L6 [Companilactobacillus crustorum]
MSRIGYKVIEIPAGVTVTQKGEDITVKGPKGELTRHFDSKIKLTLDDKEAKFTREDDNDKALHGTMRSNLNNMIIGVTEGYEKKLELRGVGYRAQVKGNTLTLSVGYSHPVVMDAPEGIKVDSPSNTEINVTGISKQKVGQFAAEIRDVRSPEPYKGKGIRYVGEYVRRKEGKTGK